MFPETTLPAGRELIAAGQRRARQVTVAPCPFLTERGVTCEAEDKARKARAGQIMRHAQVGYRDAAKTVAACRDIHAELARAGIGVDRYGICLDWSMGYPPGERADRPRGTGLILDGDADFAALTRAAPVAAHFGDFVLGTPAAIDNTQAALRAGSTAIGNLGQYFTFRLPHWDDDVATTAATVEAIAMIAAQPVDVLIHSNLDDGFAALFTDLACALGAVLLEKHVVDELLGGNVSHCYGHTYSEPLPRFAFQRALAMVATTPGTMVYGNTTRYGADVDANYVSLRAYLSVDVIAQRTRPTGHAINPVPITEAVRIPEVDEIVDAHRFADAVIDDPTPMDFDFEAADRMAERIVAGGRRFADGVLEGLAAAEIDPGDPLEVMLALRRIGAKQLEERFGPGELDASRLRGRTPLVRSSTLTDLERAARDCVASLSSETANRLRARSLTVCVATTDVHEYGKILLDAVLDVLGIERLDAGVSVDPVTVAEAAANADAIAISTYNGVALEYVEQLRHSMRERGLRQPVFVGGKLNRVPSDGSSSLPIDVGDELRSDGVFVCRRVEDMLEELAR